jgi:hypothetical protein
MKRINGINAMAMELPVQSIDSSINTEVYFYGCMSVHNEEGYIIDVIKLQHGELIDNELDKNYLSE